MYNKDKKCIAIIGSGKMGCQIALQCLVHGFQVNIYARNNNSKVKAKENILVNIGMMRMEKKISTEQIPSILKTLKFSSELQSVVKDADIIIESVAEIKEVKTTLFKQICSYCKEDAIIVTNTSTFIPSMFLDCITYPERFAAMHFHSYVWKATIVDIMGHPQTSKLTKDTLKSFAKEIGQTPIIMEKESHSYVFNSILNEVFRASLKLVVDEIVPFEDIDMSWKTIMDTSVGPFELMDLVGLDIVEQIIKFWKGNSDKEVLEKELSYIQGFTQQGMLGVKTGQGFYKY